MIQDFNLRSLQFGYLATRECRHTQDLEYAKLPRNLWLGTPIVVPEQGSMLFQNRVLDGSYFDTIGIFE